MLIEISNLSFSYEKKPILISISWEVKSGEQWVIIGKNGSGKSTLLKCIAGIENNYVGTIKIAGKNIKNFSSKERAQFIAYIPQFSNRNLPFIVSDYIMMSRYAYQGITATPSKSDWEIVNEALLLTETNNLADRRINTLSGGEQQRVFLASGVAQKSQILLLDEPTTFLDPYHQQSIIKILQRIIQENNTTILTATHELNYLTRLYSNVLAIKNKRVIFTGPIDSLYSDDLTIIGNIFEIPFEKVQMPFGFPAIFPKLDMH
jgi:ABC-type cobalamin/Fe3+-siderophores transport system ATPase subunit